MNYRKSIKDMVFGLVALMLVASAVSCAPTPTTPAGEEPMTGGTRITMLIPEDPVALNGIVTDTGYEQLMGELVLLSVAEIDPNDYRLQVQEAEA